jgi:macrolide transport system ATP-binding/permease protein
MEQCQSAFSGVQSKGLLKLVSRADLPDERLQAGSLKYKKCGGTSGETARKNEGALPKGRFRPAALATIHNNSLPARSGGDTLNSFLRDLFFGARMLLKNPGFALVAVLSLAVGIGVNSTVFGFVNALFFKSISVANSAGLVYVIPGDQRHPFSSASYETYREFRNQNEVFSGLAAYAAPPMLMTTGDHTEEISSEVVSGNYFSVLDFHMQRGQGFTSAHDELSFAEPSVVISDSLWKRRLNSDPNILGKQLILNGNYFAVVGVAPPACLGTDPTISTDVWVPITQWATIVQKAPVGAGNPQTGKTEATAPSQNQGRLGRDHNWLALMGRLKPGVSLERAKSEMATIVPRLQSPNLKPDEKLQVTLSPVTAIHPGLSEEIPAALIIMAVGSLILMICCVNVASLMLSRAAARQKEFAIRIALGSSRQRLVRQLLTEALLLSLIGGALGLLFASWTTRAVLGILPPGDLGFTAGIAIDQRVLWFSFVISLLTALLFGLLPALSSFRPDLVRSLVGDVITVGGKGRKINLRRGLVVVQIVASLVLLISTGLFLRSFQKGGAIVQNFRSDRILLLDLNPRKFGYSVQYSGAFYRDLLASIGALPGVESATLCNAAPFAMDRNNASVGIEGRDSTSMHRAVVANGFFRTFNIPILRGREFDKTDDDTSRKVAIINESMARKYWPNENPLGKLLDMHGGKHEIVGVAKDSPYNSLGKASEPYIYVSLYQRTNENVSLIVRSSAAPKNMISLVQQEIKGLGGNLPIFDFKTLDEVSNSQLVLVKAAASLLSLLSLIGLLVASIGIYGVTSYAFNRRRREIGIRMSLGAQRSDILKLIMKEGVSLALAGIAIGVLLALGTTHFVSSFLYGVSPVDPIVFLGVAALLATVALGASLAPAILAARSNPVEALRYE